MASVWTIVIPVAIGIVAIVVAARVMHKAQGHKAEDRRAAIQYEAHSTADHTGQREERRLANMSADDQAWEQASLQRQRERDLVPQMPPS